MSAGAGTKAYKAWQLERLLIAAYGPEFREKAVVTAFGTFRLADAFAECGLEDPRAPEPSCSGAYGLWQMVPATHERTPEESVRAGLERLRREYGDPGQWRRYARGSTSWPLSLGPRSPHGDAVLSPAGRR